LPCRCSNALLGRHCSCHRRLKRPGLPIAPLPGNADLPIGGFFYQTTLKIVIPRAMLARGICFCLDSAPRFSAPLQATSRRCLLSLRSAPPFESLPGAPAKIAVLIREKSSRPSAVLNRRAGTHTSAPTRPVCPDERKGRAGRICSQGRKPLVKEKNNITPLAPSYPRKPFPVHPLKRPPRAIDNRTRAPVDRHDIIIL
jgi:hypothetical protein